MDRQTDENLGADAKASALFAGSERPDPPVFQVDLRPHRSLPRRGFVLIIALTAIMFSLPLLPALGSLALWGLLPYLLLALGGLWYFIERSYKDRSVLEKLRLWPDLITVQRLNPRTPDQSWAANPYWVTLHLHKNRPVENYLTLKGNGREIELGAFLSPDERLDLHRTLGQALGKISALQTS
jgi:uncharacterized membrane protein